MQKKQQTSSAAKPPYRFTDEEYAKYAPIVQQYAERKPWDFTGKLRITVEDALAVIGLENNQRNCFKVGNMLTFMFGSGVLSRVLSRKNGVDYYEYNASRYATAKHDDLCKIFSVCYDSRDGWQDINLIKLVLVTEPWCAIQADTWSADYKVSYSLHDFLLKLDMLIHTYHRDNYFQIKPFNDVTPEELSTAICAWSVLVMSDIRAHMDFYTGPTIRRANEHLDILQRVFKGKNVSFQNAIVAPLQPAGSLLFPDAYL